MEKPINGTENVQIRNAGHVHNTADMVKDDTLGKSAYILLLGQREQGYAECVEK